MPSREGKQMEKTKKQELEKWYDENFKIHEQFCLKFKNTIEDIIKTESIPFQSITFRVKEKQSFIEKCGNYEDPLKKLWMLSEFELLHILGRVL
jgi:ppGpp synthetase/RelA/SpoT-type nucleotidyltranferase